MAIFFSLLAKKYDPHAIDAGLFAMTVDAPRCVPVVCSKMIAEDGYGIATVNGKPVSQGKCYKFDFSPLPIYLLPVGEAATDFDTVYTVKLSGYKTADGKRFRDISFKLKTPVRPVDDGKHTENEQAAKAVSDEGIVLLQNSGVLPLVQGTKVKLLGEYEGFRVSTVGAGAIKPRWQLSVREAIEKTGKFSISDEADTALYFISRSSGENKDNRPIKGGYYLTDKEKTELTNALQTHKNVILIFNTGYPVEMKFLLEASVSAMLWTGFPGQRGAESLADILCGAVNPSGKLADTWPLDYYDAPSSKNFINLDENSPNYSDDGKKYGARVYYEEGLFVGYRYFDSYEKETAFCFGHGFSYTEFNIKSEATFADGVLTVNTTVKNTGACKGKQVVHVYVSAPKTELAKPRRTLAGFDKTSLLTPNDSQELVIEIPAKDFAVYDDKLHAFVLEKGDYTVWVGDSLETAAETTAFSVDETVILEKTASVCTPLEDVKGESAITAAKDCIAKHYVPQYREHHELQKHRGRAIKLQDVKKDESLLDAFVSQLSLRELARFSVCNGALFAPHQSGAAGRLGAGKKYGIPTLYMSDGNSGVNLNTRTTGFPVSNLLAGTFNRELAYKVGSVLAAESKEHGIAINLGPGANLHRNILCGRHPEYFSEDPILAGTLMAYQAKGLEENGIQATYKHLLANSMEFERKAAHSVIDERTVRELYLRVFDKAFSLHKPSCVMTSYNPVNGIYPSENPDLLETLLRDCWGFEGFVMTDWNSYDTADSIKSLKAGTSLLTPGSKKHVRMVLRAAKSGEISKAALQHNVKWIMKVLAKCI